PNGKLAPDAIFGIEAMFSGKGFLILILGGFLIGFGTRYAGGCTSGHAISGLSNLQLPSLIAVIGFFLGGLVMAHFLIPLIF
ncbi:MAG TPA: YeeE/YedE thiosulfate transporter family protein, partial [Flavobacterium sp.]|nr:YeeE/YedE thiosulfate transporter family protein [Flavobacterium sp.]